MSLLQVESMTHYFGGLRAVHDYNLRIRTGPDPRADRSQRGRQDTIFNLITGIYQPSEGTIRLEDEIWWVCSPIRLLPSVLAGPFRTCFCGAT